jgi:2-iminobutanoate/2-iminopropanoate deaminase
MPKKVISSEKAPRAIGPFSQAILVSGERMMELSGQVAIDPGTGKLVDGGIEEQTEQVLNNIGAVLSEAGWGFGNIIKARIYLTSMSDYQKVNEIYGKRFKENPPARIAIAVKELPLGALIEIECVASG